jgi:S1-C subfamily serine protease
MDEYFSYPPMPPHAPSPPESFRRTVSYQAVAIIIAICVAISSTLTFLISYFILRGMNVPNIILRPIHPEVVYNLKDDYYAAVAQKALPSVVEIVAGSSRGSGVIVGKTEDNYPIIMTNRHVIESAISSGTPSSTGRFLGSANVRIRFAYSGVFIYNSGVFETNIFTMLGYDQNIDIALFSARIELQDEEGHCVLDDSIIEFANSRHLAYGQTVLAIGNAIGNGLSVTQGIVSLPEYTSAFSIRSGSTAQTVRTRVVQHTAPINNGNSGGALVDMNGRLVGINTYTAVGEANQTISNIAYAVSSNNARAIMDNIIANLNTSRPIDSLRQIINLTYNPIAQNQAHEQVVMSRLNLTVQRRPQVADSNVFPYFHISNVSTGPAHSAGLRPGHRITGIGSTNPAVPTAEIFDENGVFVFHRFLGLPSVLLFEELFFYYGIRDIDRNSGLGEMVIHYLDNSGNSRQATIAGVYLRERIPFV